MTATLLPDGQVHEIPLRLIHPSEVNPRQTFTDESIRDLAASIAEVGLLHPIIVEPDPDTRGEYLLVDGERRWRALNHLSQGLAACIVRRYESPEARQTAMLVTSLQRADLTPLEEADAYQRLLDLELTQGDIATRVGRSKGHVSKRLSLLKLPAPAREQLTTGGLSLTTALELAQVPAAKQREIVQETSGSAHLDDDVHTLLARHHRDVERIAQRKALVDEWTAKGVEILDERPKWDSTTYRRATTGEEPTAVHLDDWDQVLKFVPYDQPLPAQTTTGKSPTKQSKADTEHAERRARCEAANTARRVHLEAVLTGHSKPKRSMNDLVGLATPILTACDTDHSILIEVNTKDLRELFDVDRLDEIAPPASTPADKLRLWVALIVLAADDAAAGDVFSGRDGNDWPSTPALLRFAAEVGYTLTRDELELLEETPDENPAE